MCRRDSNYSICGLDAICTRRFRLAQGVDVGVPHIKRGLSQFFRHPEVELSFLKISTSKIKAINTEMENRREEDM